MDERVRELSRTLFGGQYRLELGAAISEGDLVTIKDLAERPGDPPGTSSVNAELKVLEAAGLLQRVPRVGSDRRVFLQARPSSYWNTCRELVEYAQARAVPARGSP
jgi:hypothetical protein